MTRRPERILSVLFVLSGIAALANEIAWSEVLSHTLGHGTGAISVVTAVFLGGLAAGAHWGGRLAARSRRRVALYGGLELGVGVLSFALIALLPRLPRFTAGLGVGGPGGSGVATIAVVSSLCLFPVTFLMGATLPTLVGALAADARQTARQAARLASLNAIGGTAGALAAVFALLPLLGTRQTLGLMAALGVAVGLVALAVDRQVGPPAAAANPPPSAADRGPVPARWLLPGSLVVAGMASLAAQIAWTRVFAWLVGPSIYVFGLLLAVFVAGMAGGGAAMVRRGPRTARPWHLLAGLELGLGLSVWLSVILIPRLPEAVASLAGLARNSPGLLQAGEAGIALVILGPSTLLIGAAFPVACRLLVPGRGSARGVGTGNGLLTAGNVLGALAAGFLLPAWLDSRGVLLAAALAFVAVGGVLFLATGRRRDRRVAVLAVASTALLAWATPAWEPALMASGPALNGPGYVDLARATGRDLASIMRARGSLILTAEGPDALVTVRSLPGGGASLQINGKTEASTGGDLRSQILAAQVPLLYAAHPRSMLTIGLASGITAGSLLTRDADELVIVEISPTSVAAARCAPFAEASGQVLEDARTRLVVADARSALLHDTRRYDLIASQPSNPWVPGVAALYTREFFRLVRGRLRSGGVFGQWVQAYGLSADDFRGILRTFAQVFPYCVLYEESLAGGDYFLVGSDVPLERNATHLLARLTPAVRRELARVGIDGPASLLAHHVLDSEQIRAFAGTGPLETDDRLRLAFSAPWSIRRPTSRLVIDGLETLRRPPLDMFDASGLDPAIRDALLVQLGRSERARIDDRQFMELLDERSGRLADPVVIEAIALARSGRFGVAYGHLADALETAPGPPALDVLAGDLAARLGESDLAVFHYRSALARMPGSTAARLGLALAVMRTDPARAGPLLDEVLARRPDLALARLARATIDLRTGDLQAARLALEQFVDRTPGWAPAWSNLGIVYRRLGDDVRSEAAYRRAVSLQPGLSEAWFNLGVLLRDEAREGEAVAAFTNGLRAAPDDCDLRGALARSTLPVPPLPVSLQAPCDPSPGPAIPVAGGPR